MSALPPTAGSTTGLVFAAAPTTIASPSPPPPSPFNPHIHAACHSELNVIRYPPSACACFPVSLRLSPFPRLASNSAMSVTARVDSQWPRLPPVTPLPHTHTHSHTHTHHRSFAVRTLGTDPLPEAVQTSWTAGVSYSSFGRWLPWLPSLMCILFSLINRSQSWCSTPRPGRFCGRWGPTAATAGLVPCTAAPRSGTSTASPPRTPSPAQTWCHMPRRHPPHCHHCRHCRLLVMLESCIRITPSRSPPHLSPSRPPARPPARTHARTHARAPPSTLSLSVCVRRLAHWRCVHTQWATDAGGSGRVSVL